MNLNKLISVHKLDEHLFKEILEKITSATKRANNIFYHSDIRLKVISSLRKQFESFYRIKADAEVLDEIRKIIDAFIEGFQILKDEDYFKFKEKVISKNDATVGWFNKYEGLGETEGEQK